MLLKELDNKYAFVANEDEHIKTKNTTEKIDHENMLGVMGSRRLCQYVTKENCQTYH